MIIRPFALLIVFVLVFSGGSSATNANERIQAFDADITIAVDGKITVTETIVAQAEQNQIKRGIYRDFPTMYTSKYGVKIRLPFEVKRITRDGKPEPFHIENQFNGVRVYVGSENVLLKRGTYRYQITYETNYQIGYFATHDEFYWNVTGNGWDFPIDRVRVRVHVPAQVPREQMTVEGYTGSDRSTQQNLTATIDTQSGDAIFATTKALPPRQGLTIVLTMPKNFLREPTAAERRQLYLAANRSVWIMIGGVLAIVGYYLYAWFRVGRDPASGTIIPRFEPPQEMSPAAVRYLRKMAYDKKCFTAAVINLAVSKVVTIDEGDNGFTLQKVVHDGPKARSRAATRQQSAGEKAIVNQLLRGKKKTLKLEQSNHAVIKSAITQLGQKLEDEYHGKLFYRNRHWLIPGWILSALALAIAAVTSGWNSLPIILFLSAWLSIWSLGSALLAVAAFSAWRAALKLRTSTAKRIGSFGGAIFMTLFATPFLIAEFVVIGILVYHSSILILPLILVVMIFNWLFWHLIKRPTDQGQVIRDEIEGFRMYLSTAEKEFLRQMHPPDKTVQLYEKYLPYALALDVENEWAENFKDVLAAASGAPSSDRSRMSSYQPSWYHGSSWNNFTTGAFASGLGAALGSAISASATAPGGSSGSSSFGGGGGFSGGGGGGGGGGGW